MANTSEAIATANLLTTNTMAATDYILVSLVTGASFANGATRNISLGNFAQTITNSALLVIPAGGTPGNSTAWANVFLGQIWFDGNFVYVGTATGVSKRIALSTF